MVIIYVQEMHWEIIATFIGEAFCRTARVNKTCRNTYENNTEYLTSGENELPFFAYKYC